MFALELQYAQLTKKWTRPLVTERLVIAQGRTNETRQVKRPAEVERRSRFASRWP